MQISNSFLKESGIRIDKSGKLLPLCDTDYSYSMEDYIMLSRKGKTYYIYEVHRADKKLKKEETDKNKAVIWAVISYKRLHDVHSDRTAGRKLRMMIEAGDEFSAEEVFSEFESSIFSVGEEKEDSLCLIKKNGKVIVLYNGKTIAEQVSLSRAYVVLYHYCRNLRAIQKFYIKHKKRMLEAGITSKDAVELYIGV